jgi:hypothetical protein
MDEDETLRALARDVAETPGTPRYGCERAKGAGGEFGFDFLCRYDWMD